MPSASTAVDGAVVSKPTAKNANCFWGSCFAISTASETAYTILTSAPAALASKSDILLPGTRNTSPKHVTTMPIFANCTASSISAAGTMQTGHPGPAITSTVSGKRLRKPKCVIVHSWVPQTWQIFIFPAFGAKLLIFDAIFCANSGFLNFRFSAMPTRSTCCFILD